SRPSLSPLFPYTTLFRSRRTSASPHGTMPRRNCLVESWKRNLYVVWLAQMTAIVGMSLVNPFLPLYLHTDLHVPDATVKLWASRSEEHTSELQSHLNLVC